MESRYPIFPWTCWVSLLAHAVLLAVFFGISANSDANVGLGETAYQVQLVECRFDNSGFLDGGGGGGSGPVRRERKAPDKTVKAAASDPAGVVQNPPENVSHVAENNKTEATQPPVPATSELQNNKTAQNVNPGNINPTGDNSTETGDGSGSGIGSGTGSGTGSGSGSGPGTGGFGHGGGGNGPNDERDTSWEPAYRKAVYSKISRAKIYPYAARVAKMEGRVVVRFSVTSSGGLASVSIVSASPYSVLNDDAEKWIQRAAPFPAFPKAAERSTITFTYTLRYELKD